MGLCMLSWPRLSPGPRAGPLLLPGVDSELMSTLMSIPLPSCHLSWASQWQLRRVRHPGALWTHPRTTLICQDLTLHGLGGQVGQGGLTVGSWKPDLSSSPLHLPTPPKSISSHLQSSPVSPSTSPKSISSHLLEDATSDNRPDARGWPGSVTPPVCGPLPLPPVSLHTSC